MSSTFERMKQVFKVIVNQEIHPEMPMTSLNLDELDLAELIVDLEDEFHITIADSDAECFRTVGEIMEYIESRPTLD